MGMYIADGDQLTRRLGFGNTLSSLFTTSQLRLDIKLTSRRLETGCVVTEFVYAHTIIIVNLGE